jgi:hypothetical protein
VQQHVGTQQPTGTQQVAGTQHMDGTQHPAGTQQPGVVVVSGDSVFIVFLLDGSVRCG